MPCVAQLAMTRQPAAAIEMRNVEESADDARRLRVRETQPRRAAPPFAAARASTAIALPSTFDDGTVRRSARLLVAEPVDADPIRPPVHTACRATITTHFSPDDAVTMSRNWDMQRRCSVSNVTK